MTADPKHLTPEIKRYSYDAILLMFWAGFVAGCVFMAGFGRYIITHGGCK